jgi:hypothetical protein
MKTDHRIGGALTIATSLALLMMALGSCSGSQGSISSAKAPLLEADSLPWPPQEAAGRVVSDDSMLIRGVDYSTKHGSAANMLSSLRLSPNPTLSWAIYTLSGLGPDCTVSSINADFSIISGSTGDGTGLYWLLANYALGRWEWVLGTVPTETFSFAGEFTNYVSPEGSLSIACIHTGLGTTQVNGIAVHRVGAGATVPAPQNLGANAIYGEVQLDWDSVPFAIGYNIYRDDDSAFDNPVKVNGTSIVSLPNYEDASVAPLNPYWYAVKALRGDTGDEQESGYSNVVSITSMDSTIPAPENLVGSGDLLVAHLSWDPVEGAAGYRVYRDTTPAFNSPPTQVGGILTTTSYDDSLTFGADKRYVYCVTAVSAPFESAYSNMVDVSIPNVDLPAPTNVHVAAQSGDYVSIAWDYPDLGQSAFHIYFSWTKDFTTGPYYFDRKITNPAKRDYALFGIPGGSTLYVRVVAYDASDKRGRYSDDISFTTENYWYWSSPETIGVGQGPISLITAEGDATLVYSSGGAVNVARRTAGLWGSEGVGLDGSAATGGFGRPDTNLDIAYSGLDYIIGAFASDPDDAWVCTGTLGNWSPLRIDGDDSNALSHAESGAFIKVAATPDEYSAVHVSYIDPGNGIHDLRLQQKPHSGGSWNNVQIAPNVPELLQDSIAYGGTNLNVLYMDVTAHQLMYGDKDGGWAWQDIADSGTENLGLGNDLKPFGAAWITPAYNGASGDLFAMDGSGASWTKTLVGGGLSNLNRMQICVTAPGEAVMIFYSSSNSRWFYGALKDGSWKTASIVVPGVVTFGVNMDITDIGGYPLIAFDDDAGNLYASLGAPPT